MSTPGPLRIPELEWRRRDTEIVVAAFRTIFLLVVLFSPEFMEAQGTKGGLLTASVIAATLYNLGLFIVHARGWPFPRTIIIAGDLLLISLWLYFCGPDSERFFVLYYVVVIVAGLWFEVSGALISALAASGLYAAATVIAPLPPGEAGIPWARVALQIIFLVATAGLVSFAFQMQARERQALATSLASLQEHRQRIRTARYVDEMLRPRRLPSPPGLEVAFRFRPAAQLDPAGDYYDLIPLGRRCWGFCIADVRAKQETGLFYLPIFKSALRVAARRERSPARVLGQVNQDVAADMQEHDEPEAFISLCYAVIDLDEGSLTYANAGIEPPVVVPASGAELITLSRAAIVLGVLPEATYEEERLPLHTGDTVVLFTDGMTEVAGRANRLLGREGLVEQIKAHAEAPTAAAMAQRIFEYVYEYGRSGQRRDDMTLLIARVTATDLGAETGRGEA